MVAELAASEAPAHRTSAPALFAQVAGMAVTTTSLQSRYPRGRSTGCHHGGARGWRSPASPPAHPRAQPMEPAVEQSSAPARSKKIR